MPEFKARYLKKQMDLMVMVNVLTFDIQGAGRKGITLRLYNVAVLKDAPVVNVAGGQGSDRSSSKRRRVQTCGDHEGAVVFLLEGAYRPFPYEAEGQ